MTHPSDLVELRERQEPIEVSYPFVRQRYLEFSEVGETERESWRPGVRFDTIGAYGEYEGKTVAFAEGVGAQLLTIVSTHKPGRYPERVFYTRQWRDPDGRVFGKPRLRMTTARAFAAMARGYRYDFQIEEPQAALTALSQLTGESGQ